MNNQQKIAAVLDSLQISSPTTFNWFGEPNGKLAKSVLHVIDAPTARRHLVKEIQTTLYRSFYGYGFPFANRDEQDAFGYGGNPEYVRKLSAANHGQGCWTDGWNIQSHDGDTLVVERNGLVFTAAPSQVRENENSVAVATPKEQLGISPGHYLAQSNIDMQKADKRVRVYWNIAPNGGSKLMSEITGRLNDLNVPFRFKIMNDPSRFARCDVAVLYLRQSDFSQVSEALGQTIAFVSDWLRPGVPALTKQIYQGVGLAEDPETRESFGLHRCGILAEGIVTAHEHGCHSVEEMLPHVEATFVERGFTLDQAHLNPGSIDQYQIAISTHHESQPTIVNEDGSTLQTAVTAGSANPQNVEMESSNAFVYHQAALNIANAIADSALWHEDRCTWISPDLVANEICENASTSNYTTLDATLYQGNAGVALFLAETAQVLNDSRLRRVAVAAARQAVSQLDGIEPERRLGMYCGWPGVAATVARVAALTGDESLAVAAERIVEERADQEPETGEFDVISGLAGGILSLISLYRTNQSSVAIELAQSFADRLIDAAVQDEAGVSWRSPDGNDLQNLTGYSHGTSGAAHALLELYAIVGNETYQSIAESAFAYERICFDHDQKNWPDYRAPKDGRAAKETKCMCAWCHGAPGIAVSRIRAAEILQNEEYRDEANVAFETTRRSVLAWLQSDDRETSLCHSGMGNAEIYSLLTGDDELVKRVAAKVASRIDPAMDLTTSGPGMMIGLAGIGQFLLRRIDPSLPSVLAPVCGVGFQRFHPVTVEPTGSKQAQ